MGIKSERLNWINLHLFQEIPHYAFILSGNRIILKEKFQQSLQSGNTVPN